MTASFLLLIMAADFPKCQAELSGSDWADLLVETAEEGAEVVGGGVDC